MARPDGSSACSVQSTMTRGASCLPLPAALLFVLALVTAAQPANAFDLADLAALRMRVAESAARFHETRHIGALATPVERTGTLLYRRPGHLEMNVETPLPEQLVIDGRRLRLTTASGVRTLSLDDEPALLAWTESLRATLAGDTPALLRHFDAELSGSEDAWTLTLDPHDQVLRSQIAAIVISGAGATVRRIETHEQGGDDAVMEIVPQRPRTP